MAGKGQAGNWGDTSETSAGAQKSPWFFTGVQDWVRSVVGRFPITAFLAQTFIWSWGFWLFLALSGIDYERRLWKYLYVTGLSGPLIASVSITWITEGTRGLKTLARQALRWKIALRWYFLALFLAPATMFGASILSRVLFQQDVEIPRVTPAGIGLTFAWMLLRGGPVNEELGWRGFLLPKLLQRQNPFRATLLLIPIWAAWHWPLWILPGLPHKYWPLPCFFMIIAPITFLFTWLYFQTGKSVLIPMLFHGAINTTIHFLPLLPPRHPGLMPFILWISLTWSAALLVLWTARATWFLDPKTRSATVIPCKPAGERKMRYPALPRPRPVFCRQTTPGASP